MTPKQQRFVEEYLVDLNATQAAIRAGYSESTANQIGWQLLQKTSVSKAVAERMDALSMRAAEVLMRLTEIARGTVADVITILPGGSWKIDLEKAERLGKLHLVHELAFDRNGNPRVKLYSAHEALRDLGKARGIFVDRLELNVEELPELVVRNELEE